MNFLEIYWTDVYKTGHKFMLPPGSNLMLSNMTPRSGRLSNANLDGVIAIGMQKMVRQMKEDWGVNFFGRPVSEIDEFGRDMTEMLMLPEPYDVSHFKQLHELGYLPLEVRAVEEGVLLPYKVPLYTIMNTQPINNQIFDWLVNYLETICSAESWMMPTSATTAFCFKKDGKTGIELTDPENMWFLDYKYHDFSMRGLSGKSSIINSGLGFAAVSKGSDTLPVIPAARKFYDETDACINSVLATEHAVMCAVTGFYLKEKDGSWDRIGDLEIETFLYLLRKFPNGILSLVSDTWDLYRVITDYCVKLKDEILARDGKLVIRPDSGDPVDILTGTIRYSDKESYDAYIRHTQPDERTPEMKGVIELLWEIFGGDITSTGYKRLHPKVGAIYGDSITLERSRDIDKWMIAKKFATTNYVLGVGSYSLQRVTRDTHGFAQKATYIEVDGYGIEIFKDPVTDNGVKKSARGLLSVYKDDAGRYMLKDRATWDEFNSDDNQLKVIFKDGEFFNPITLTKIRENINKLL